MAACPGLTELTITCPDLFDAVQTTETRVLFDLARSARSAVLELVDACKTLPDFEIFQIARFPLGRHPLIQPPPKCFCGVAGCDGHEDPGGTRERALREQVEDLKDLVIEHLKKSETGCQERRNSKGATLRLRVIEFGPDHPKVEEYE